MKKIVNPKRIKILIGIIVILLFGFALDLMTPIKKQAVYPDYEYPDYGYYSKQLDIICDAIDKYYEKHNEFPQFLFGGDKEGWRLAGKYQIDPLIEDGILDSYPLIKYDSIKLRRLHQQHKMKSISDRVLFGKNGDRMCNILYCDLENAKKIWHENMDGNPLFGNFCYRRLENRKNAYIIFIVDSSYENMMKNITKDSFDALSGIISQYHYIDENGKLIKNKTGSF